MAMLFSSPLHSLELRDIENFCRTWPEGIRVEYKRELNASARHIPKSVSSFANTSGGVLILGVATGVDNLPVFPIRGFPREPGIEERITQMCYQNLYPPLFPDIKIIDVPEHGGNALAVVQTIESVEAPHAIENSTKVYIRTNSTTEIIQLAEIDRIEYLLKRRQQPEQKREEMIDGMASRSTIGPPCIRIVIAPRYPWRPILGEQVLIARLNELSQPGTYVNLRHSIRLVRQGLMTAGNLSGQSPEYHFEVNLYGAISCYVRLGLDGPRVFFDQIVSEICMALNLARPLLKGTNQNWLTRVNLQGVRDTFLVVPNQSGVLKSIEDEIQAEENFMMEGLEDSQLFQDHVAELVRLLMWSFNWAERDRIIEKTRERLQRHGIS